MAIPFINIPNFALDIVGVYDDGLTPMFGNVSFMKASVKMPSKSMEHPLEKGSIITDHKIILPTEISLFLVATRNNYRNVFAQIKRAFLGSNLLSVQTKTSIHKNMVITDLPYEENPDAFDAITIQLKLKEVQYATTEGGFTPANETDQSQVNRGLIPTNDATAPQIVSIEELL